MTSRRSLTRQYYVAIDSRVRWTYTAVMSAARTVLSMVLFN